MKSNKTITIIVILIVVFVGILLLQKSGFRWTFASETMPTFRLRDISGNDYFSDSKENTGKVLLINFGSQICSACMEELPYLEGFHLKYKDKGLNVVSIFGKEDQIDQLQFIAKSNSITYSFLLDKNSLVKNMFNVFDLPHTVFSDRNGKIRYIHKGFSVSMLAQLEKEIKQLLNEPYNKTHEGK
jgi:peroxiredoxin